METNVIELESIRLPVPGQIGAVSIADRPKRPLLKVVPFEPQHYLSIENTLELTRENREFLAKTYLTGPAYTMFSGEEIICCVGVMILWDGVGEAWAVVTPLAKKYPIYIVKMLRKMIPIAMETCHLERMQAVAVKEDPIARKFAEKFGFKEEGEMKKYIAGKTYVRLSIIKPED